MTDLPNEQAVAAALKMVLDAHQRYLNGEPGGVRLNLRGANMTDADMTGALMLAADMAGALMTGADMTGADMIGASMIGACMTDADLRCADFRGARMRGADFCGALLEQQQQSATPAVVPVAASEPPSPQGVEVE